MLISPPFNITIKNPLTNAWFGIQATNNALVIQPLNSHDPYQQWIIKGNPVNRGTVEVYNVGSGNALFVKSNGFTQQLTLGTPSSVWSFVQHESIFIYAITDYQIIGKWHIKDSMFEAGQPVENNAQVGEYWTILPIGPLPTAE